MPREKARPPFRWRLWLTVFAWCAIFVSSAVAARHAHRYVLRDPQFMLSSEDRNALTLQGVTYAARAKLLRVFAGDYGRSIFAVPLDERRRRLLAVDWVEDAAVSRIWPNRLLVRITERQPVAFVSLPLHGGSGSAARLEPAAAVLDRYATAATEFGGVQIERGQLVRLSLAAANRDPALFPAPDAFALDRPPRRHLAFAQGPHVCVGVHLARLETRVGLTALLSSLPGLRLAAGDVPAIPGAALRKRPRGGC